MGQLMDRIAVITGASTGIGKGIAVAYAAEGAKVVLASRSREKLEAVAGEIRNTCGTALVVPTNVTLEEDKLVVRPLEKMMTNESPYVIKPKYAKEEYLKVLEKISLYMKKNGPIWTKEDDKNREIMRKKEKKWDW